MQSTTTYKSAYRGTASTADGFDCIDWEYSSYDDDNIWFPDTSEVDNIFIAFNWIATETAEDAKNYCRYKGGSESCRTSYPHLGLMSCEIPMCGKEVNKDEIK